MAKHRTDTCTLLLQIFIHRYMYTTAVAIAAKSAEAGSCGGRRRRSPLAGQEPHQRSEERVVRGNAGKDGGGQGMREEWKGNGRPRAWMTDSRDIMDS